LSRSDTAMIYKNYVYVESASCRSSRRAANRKTLLRNSQN